jgi:hypothetical protein
MMKLLRYLFYVIVAAFLGAGAPLWLAGYAQTPGNYSSPSPQGGAGPNKWGRWSVPLQGSPSAVFSVRLAVQGYIGNAMRVRRGLDNTTIDLAFVDGYLDVSTANNFAQGSQLFVVKWYDQSGALACGGAACDVVQAEAADQPALIISFSSGRAAVGCGGSYIEAGYSEILTAANPLTLTGNLTLGIVADVWGSEWGEAVSDFDGHTPPYTGWGLSSGNPSAGSRFGSFWSSGTGTFAIDNQSLTTSSPTRFVVTRTSGATAFYVNGVATATAPGTNNSAPTIGLSVCSNPTSNIDGVGGTAPFNGAISEVYAYKTALSANNLALNDRAENNFFKTRANTPFLGRSAITIGGNETGGQAVTVGTNVFQYERTQAWTMTAAIKMYAPPPLASIIFSNVALQTGYPGYEVWIDTSCFVHVRLINDVYTNMLGVIGSVNLCDGNWHFVGVTYDGTSRAAGVHIYEDCGADPAPTIEVDNLTASIKGTTNIFLIGTQTGFPDFDFRGVIDEFGLDNTNHSAAYMESHCTAAKPPSPTAPYTAVYYHFDDDTGITATDASGNGHTATLTSSTQWFPN